MAQTATKIEYPTGQDPFQPHRDMKRLAESAPVIVPVADRSEADEVATILAPTAQTPLFVNRADTGDIERYDGTTWATFRAYDDTGYHDFTHRLRSGITASRAALRRIGEHVEVRASLSGSFPEGTTEVASGLTEMWLPRSNAQGACYLQNGYSGVAFFRPDGSIAISWRGGSTRNSAQFTISFFRGE